MEAVPPERSVTDAKHATCVRRVMRDGKPVYQVRCPNCGKWGDIDDAQLRGRVSMLHEECGWHETLDLSGDPLVQQNDEYEYLRGMTRGR